MNRQQSFVSAAGRVLLAVLFLVSGFGKLAAPAATKTYILSAGMPFPDLAYLLALAVEIGLAMALLLGYRTRVVATLMAVFTVATEFAFHSPFYHRGAVAGRGLWRWKHLTGCASRAPSNRLITSGSRELIFPTSHQHGETP